MKNKRIDYLKSIISILPETPGVYQYFDSIGKIIYVGKAKNLKRRVSSYFNKEHDSLKTKLLVEKIYDIKYICVNSEADALLLENNLIKQYQPHYNILLKDGKTYPWLCITKEDFPRVFKTRNVSRGAEYYGPYPSSYTLDTLLSLIKELFPIRTCNGRITEQGVKENKYKLCLKYHIHSCCGACVGYYSKAQYDEMIEQIRDIAKGHSKKVSDYLLQQMEQLSSQLLFEEALQLKYKYDAIINYQNKSIITTINDNDIDVFGYEDDENSAYINILRITEGAVTQGFTIEYSKKLDETPQEILSCAIVELRERFKSCSKDIIVPFLPDYQLDNLNYIVPQKGDKKRLLELSEKNVKQYKVDKYKQSDKLNPEQRQTRLLKEIQNLLKLPNLPKHIECFDNSNIQGSDAVAACVVYKMAKPSKSDYRKYIIKTVVGPDDYASMAEVVFRRYNRMIEEGQSLPDIILTDGGRGQMEVVRQVIEEQLGLKIPIAGLVKNDKHRTSEVLVGFPIEVVGLKPTDYLFNFFTQIQDEVHRFAITFHKQKRSKHQVESALDSINGVGQKTKDLLLKHFKSVKKIQSSSKEQLQEIVGTNRASIIYAHFHPEKES